MNHNLEEQKIKQLFLELRQQDENNAPPFAAVLNSALANPRQTSIAWAHWRTVAALAMLILVIGASFLIFRQSFTTQQGKAATTAEAFSFNSSDWIPRSTPVALNPAQTASANQQHIKGLYKAVYRKRIAPLSQQANLLISHWQSPTHFLLRTPGDQWLRSLPQLNESVLEIKNLLPDGKN